jgi:hypothetical protein
VPSTPSVQPIGKGRRKTDIEVPKELSLKTAHVRALRKVLETNSHPLGSDDLKKSLETVQKELDEMEKMQPSSR